MEKRKTRSKAKIVCRELKGIIVKDKAINTYEKLAQKVGISENALTLKINGNRAWWFWEIAKVCECFGYGNDFKAVFPELYECLHKSA